MELVLLSRKYRDVDGKPTFDRNTLILKNHEQYFCAYSYDRFFRQDNRNLEELDMYPIPSGDIYPPFSPAYTLAPLPLSPECFVKHPDLLAYAPDTPVGGRPCDQFGEELRICEILRQHPHPNIAEYLGCTVRDNLVIGLVFRKYSTTLAHRFDDTVLPLRTDVYLRGIMSGIMHLHDIGLIHNDINPDNIMLRDDDTPAIIDFDTCQAEGEKCKSAGTEPWSLEEMEFAVRENDYHGFQKIREALENRKLPEDDEPLT